MNLRFRLAAFAIMVNRIVDLRAFLRGAAVFRILRPFDASDTIKNVQPNSFDWHEGRVEISIFRRLQLRHLHQSIMYIFLYACAGVCGQVEINFSIKL